MLFQKNLQDLIKFSKCAGDPQSFLSSSLAEIKSEIKSQDLHVKTSALLKLYFLKMEDFDIRWANFDILQLMSSPSFTPKLLAYTTASLTFESQSECIMMTTNLFKKELKNPSYIETSVMMSCLTNICTQQIAVEIIEPVMGLINHTKPVIRKKTAALLGRMFAVAPELIPNNLEKILAKIGTSEENSSVLVGYINIMSSVFSINAKLHPLFIKPLYEMMEKFKNNWLIIKAIKLLDKMMRLEPRLIKKLVEPYQKMLKSTSAKSIEFELLSSIIKHFKEHTALYNQACENLKSFINHTDANLRSLGLSCLKSMLNNNKNVIGEYKDYLLESLKKADFPTKKQILEIFHTFVQKDLLEEVVSELLLYLEETPGKILDEALKEALIETILKLCKKDNFQHIEDFEWLLFEVFGKLMRRVSSILLAKELSSSLLAVILRVEELRVCVQKFCVNTLMGFDEIASENQTFSEIKISIQGRNRRLDISAKEIIFQTLVFLAGEYAHNCKIPAEFFGLLDFLDNEKLLYLYGNSYHLIKDTCFKVAVGLCGILVDAPIEKLKCNLEKFEIKADVINKVIDNLSEEVPTKNLVLFAMVRVLCYLISVSQKLLKLNNASSFNSGSSNFLLGFFFSTIGLDYRAILSQENGVNDQKFLEVITMENLKKLAELRRLYSNELRPVHPEAQKFIKVPEGLRIDEVVEIDKNELEMIAMMKKEFEIEEGVGKEGKKGKKGRKKEKEEGNEISSVNEGQENVKKEEEIIEDKTNKEENKGETEEGKEDEEGKGEIKQKKEYKLNVEDYLPPGVELAMIKKEDPVEEVAKNTKKKTKKQK